MRRNFPSSRTVSHVAFSPKGTYTVTWTSFDKAKGQPNLILWDTKKGDIIQSWRMQRKVSWPLLQWCSDESVVGMMPHLGKVEFFAGVNFANPVQVITATGLRQFFLSPTTQGFYVATFLPVKGSIPGALCVYKYPQVGKEVVRKAFFADSIDLTWNARGTAALLTINQEVDSQNYYGKRALFIINVAASLDCRVTDEFVHDVQWNPNGTEFAVAYGSMPFTKVSLFDMKGNKTADIEKREARNKVLYDPHGRILCVGGFGSLNGDMDFWDITKPELKKIGFANAFSSSYHAWCPDSYHFMASVVSPRMKMDNGIKIFNYLGEKLYEESLDELYQVEWRPYPRGTYPQKDIVAKATTTAAPAKYRHPNFTGRGGSLDGNKTGADGPTRYTPSGGAYRPPVGGTLVGGTPVGGGPVGGSAARGGRGAGGGARGGRGGSPVGGSPAKQQPKQNQPKPQSPPAGESPSAGLDPEKRRKQIQLKLQQIAVLKKKQESGQTLDTNQEEKIKTQQTLEEELAKLTL